MASIVNRGGFPFFDGGMRIKQRLFSGQSATVTLTKSEMNAIFLFDSAAGITYTLPAPVIGASFRFITTVSVTSNGNKVITSGAAIFLTGLLVGVNTASSDAALFFSGNGTSHISVNQTATGSNAKGGLIGSDITFTCVSTTLWQVSGSYQSGTTATTAFSTT